VGCGPCGEDEGRGGGGFLLVSTPQGSIPVGCVPVCIVSRHHPTLLSEDAKLKMDTPATLLSSKCATSCVLRSRKSIDSYSDLYLELAVFVATKIHSPC
jgi:hypothetical protein